MSATTERTRDLGEAVLRLLGESGDARLASLTREELVSLGDSPVLADAGDEEWWARLEPAVRQGVLQTAQRGLVARNLLLADPPGLRVADEVQVVLRARHEPSWLLVLGEPRQDGQEHGPGVQVALLGIDLAAHRTSAVLVTTRLEGVYAHRLTTPAVALDAAAEWLVRPLQEGRALVGRTIEAILPADPDPAPDQAGRARTRRAIVMGDGTGWVLSWRGPDGVPGAADPVDVAGLRAALVDAVAGLGR